jgi:phage baseplate assembly protein gpV
MLTSERYVIKVMDEATNLVKSNAPGIGAASRNVISKDVQWSGVKISAGGNVPRRAKS